MTNLAIRVEHLSKQYELGKAEERYLTLRDQFLEVGKSLLNFGKQKEEKRTIWALQDVSFDVNRGEAIGIIGRNGAGKSTLLKLLSQITEPTEGRILTYGRVGSLLEVGTGFHPELTGRENVYLNGTILGMSRSEIDRKFDEIVDFSGVEQFIDTPVKRYSSGMGLRLGFAVAAHMETEILIVDEVLAVGDAEFQKKCLGKMSGIASEGRTVLFVSHNLTAVQSLCQRAIWLQNGKILENGTSDVVVTHYISAGASSQTEQIWEDINEAPGNNRVRINQARVKPIDDELEGQITIATPIIIEFDYWNLVSNVKLNLSLVLYNEIGIPIFNTIPINEPNWHGKSFPKGLFRSRCYIPGNLLNEGLHTIAIYIVQDSANPIYVNENILTFEVADVPELRGGWYGKWIGVVRPQLDWETILLRSIEEIDG
jgi:lipopolysaccharide transport system ATP-binding protein